MTQEQKELLIKDLCCRIPYGVKISKVIEDLVSEPRQIRSINLCNIIVDDGEFEDGTPDIDVWNYEDIKAYLFPLSSMTMEQAQQWHRYAEERGGLSPSTDWLNAHHFDYRGLIPMGLANDATNKNIY